MARRRTSSNTNLSLSNMTTDSPKPTKAQRHRPRPSVEQPNLGMSPESRYNHNLKVLRRRTPLFHVCVYHHNGKMWEKKGFEGSMFLYERDSYPPYGFYILNRMGMDDYIQRLYPEDVIGIHGSYLMLRSYPDFTARRLSQALGSYEGVPHKFSDIFAIPEPEKLLDGDKGRSQTVGLWMFATDAREPMIDVVMRLHSYIKQNLPYPEDFKYGPDRPPPPNPHLRTTSPSPPPETHTSDQGLDRSFPSGSGSELDKLFAKLGSATSASPSSPKSTSQMTIASLFASLGSADAQECSNSPPPPARSGIPLLDSIFASAEPTTIYSPTPTTSVLHPQILNQEVITTLLGLPPSRSASASSTSYSSDTRSHPSSREGDNEYEESRGSNAGRRRGFLGSDGFSESSTVLDPEADEELQAAGASAGRPLLSVHVQQVDTPGVNGAGGLKVNGKGRMHGDVTPRAPAPAQLVNGHRPRPSTPPRAPVQLPVTVLSASASTIRPSQSQRQTPASSSPRKQPSMPFAPSSELWPYAHGPAASAAAEMDEPEDGEIVELDFEDTSALSDPDAFRQVQQRARRNGEASASANGEEGALRFRLERRDRGKGRKKGKKERAAERAVEMQRQWDEIPAWDGSEQSYDRARPASPSSLLSNSASASPSPHPSPVHAQAPMPFIDTQTPTTARPSQVQALMLALNGGGSGPKAATRTRDAPAAGLQPERARESIISNVSARAQTLPARMERNEFVREVLTLIHTDKAFVDALWHDYMTRLA
ncbi:hypothetical protein B0H10DRAFT_2101375 [Mycena sp. CBHHK59/15]|nr:hypothetical protein B0H10DRAFT_2101375 [Mycena sp. CBHHK59/15]